MITIDGKKYRRNTNEIAKDVIKVNWTEDDKEIFDQELIEKLESMHDAIALDAITPKLFFI